MILQEEEKHKQGDLSRNKNSSHSEQSVLPAQQDSQHAFATEGVLFDSHEKHYAQVYQEALQSFKDMVEEEVDDFPYYDPRVFNDKESREAYKLAEGKFAPLVTRGPHTITDDTPPPQKTKIDTLSFTAEEPFFIMKELITLSCKEENVHFIPRKFGINGYSRGYDIVLNGRDLGVLSYGSSFNEAQNGRPQIYIEGSGKTDCFNWGKFYHYAKLLLDPRITRTDIALDTFKKDFSIESATQAHIDLKFKALKANRNPKITPYGQIQPDGTNPGRTIYIGSLQSSKFIRFYEKGYEYYKNEIKKIEEGTVDTPRLLGIQKLFETGELTTIDEVNEGTPFDIRNWIRAEVEFKNGNCELPLDMLIETDKYFSGAYPYCSEILNMTDGKKPPRLLTEIEMELDIRKKNMKAIAGSLIDDLLYLGYTEKQIIEELRGGKGPSQKLIRSGLVKH